MQKRFLRINKIIRKMLISGIIAVVLIIGFQFVFILYVQPLVKSKLENAIIKGSDGLYNCNIGVLKLNIWKGNVSALNIDIKIDSVRYKKLEATNELPDLTYEMQMGKASIKGMKILRLLFNKKIVIDKIEAKDAFIDLMRVSDSVSQQPPDKQFWKNLRPQLNGFYIGELVLDSIQVNFRNERNQEGIQWAYEKCSARLEDIRIDSIGGADSTRIFYTKNIEVNFKALMLRTKDSLYTINAGDLYYSSSLKHIKVDSFSVKPAFEREEFYKRVGYAIDQYSLQLPSLKVHNFNILSLLNHNQIEADSVEVDSPQFDIYKDLTQPTDTVIKYGQTLGQILLKAPIGIDIPKMTMKNVNITYIEKSLLTSMEGKIMLKNVNAVVTNITNNKGRISNNPFCVADMEGIFMKQSKAHVIFKFDLTTDNGHFITDATLTNLKGPELNPIVVPLALVKIKSFDLVKAHFYMDANDYSSTGKLRMTYNNLELQVLRQNADKSEVKTRSFISFLAKMAIFKENPTNNKEERISGTVSAKRDPTKNVFHMMGLTIAEGIKEIAIKKMAHGQFKFE